MERDFRRRAHCPIGEQDTTEVAALVGRKPYSTPHNTLTGDQVVTDQHLDSGEKTYV